MRDATALLRAAVDRVARRGPLRTVETDNGSGVAEGGDVTTASTVAAPSGHAVRSRLSPAEMRASGNAIPSSSTSLTPMAAQAAKSSTWPQNRLRSAAPEGESGLRKIRS